MSSPTNTQRNELVAIQEEATMDTQVTGQRAHKNETDINVANLGTTNNLHDLRLTENQNDMSLPAHDKSDLCAADASKQDQTINNKVNGSTSDTDVDANTDTTQFRRKERFTEHISSKKFGLFAYVPEFVRNICLTPYGVLFFLCWASTMQVDIESL